MRTLGVFLRINKRPKAALALAAVGLMAMAPGALQAQASPGAQTASGSFQFLQGEAAPLKRLRDALARADYREALYAWYPAAGRATFAQSPTGQALFALLLFKNGLETLGLEELFRVTTPNQINGQVQQLWRDAAPATHPVWRVARVQWNDGWRVIFNTVMGNTLATSQDKAVKTWQASLQNGIAGQSETAQKALTQMLSTPQTGVGQDRVTMAAARVLFQTNDFEGAIRYYNQVPKDSDYWLEALEEKAWAYVRLNDFDRASSVLQTLLSPLFAPQVGPEPYLLATIVSLKTCDYVTLFKQMETFKKLYRDRLSAIQQLAERGRTDLSLRSFDILAPEKDALSAASPKLSARERKLRDEVRKFGWANLGSDVQFMPRLYHRDETVRWAIESRRAMIDEVERARRIGAEARTAVGDGATQRDLQRLAAKAERRKDEAKTAYFSRLAELARVDKKEFSDILTKMHVVEAEAIQRIHLADEKSKKAATKAVAKNAETLHFPYDGEVWLDELDNYQVNLKGCPQPKKTAQATGGKKL